MADNINLQQLELEHRGRVSSKIMDWGNLVFVGLVIAQFIPGDKPINVPYIALGIIGLIGAYYLAERIGKGGGET